MYVKKLFYDNNKDIVFNKLKEQNAIKISIIYDVLSFNKLSISEAEFVISHNIRLPCVIQYNKKKNVKFMNDPRSEINEIIYSILYMVHLVNNSDIDNDLRRILFDIKYIIQDRKWKIYELDILKEMKEKYEILFSTLKK